MRYATNPKSFTWLLMAGLCATTAVAQNADDQPGLFVQAVSSLAPAKGDSSPQANSTWSGMQQQPRLPQAENDGTVKGQTLAERMNSIRRRAADSDISRPFNSEDAGSLPEVKRRPLTAMPEPELPRNSTPIQARIPMQTMAARPSSGEIVEPEPLPLEAMEAEVGLTEAPLGMTPQPPVATSMRTQPISSFTTDQGEDTDPALRDRLVNEESVRERTPTPASGRNVLLKNTAPALSFETSGPRTVVIGREAAYQVKMINMGGSEACNVVCNVKLPAWAEVVSNTSTVGATKVERTDEQDSVVRWTIDKLEAGGDESLTLRVTPRDSRSFDLAVGWSFAPDRSMAQIQVQEPKLELHLSGSEEVEFGETDVYSITISNPGTGDAENVVLNLMPMTAGQQVAGTRNIGTIPAGERKTLELELTAHQAGRLQVRATAYADNDLRAEASQEVTVRRANLDVVAMGPPRNYAATSATYKIRVENSGDAAATATQATASLPAGAKFVSCTDGGKFVAERGQVEWEIGSLRPGAVRVLEMNCELNSAGENRVDIQCASSHDLNISRSVITMVEALADLKLYVNDPQGAIPVGQEAEYEIRVVNRGTKAAENIQITGYFSNGIEPEAITRGGGGEVATGQVIFEPISSIAPGQDKVFRIAARANAPGNHVFRAELQCRSPETRLAAEEWTKYFHEQHGNVQQASRLEMVQPYQQ